MNDENVLVSHKIKSAKSSLILELRLGDRKEPFISICRNFDDGKKKSLSITHNNMEEFEKNIKNILEIYHKYTKEHPFPEEKPDYSSLKRGKWTKEEDTKMLKQNDSGLSSQSISKYFNRTPSSIRKRIAKLRKNDGK